MHANEKFFFIKFPKVSGKFPIKVCEKVRTSRGRVDKGNFYLSNQVFVSFGEHLV